MNSKELTKEIVNYLVEKDIQFNHRVEDGSNILECYCKQGVEGRLYIIVEDTQFNSFYLIKDEVNNTIHKNVINQDSDYVKTIDEFIQVTNFVLAQLKENFNTLKPN